MNEIGIATSLSLAVGAVFAIWLFFIWRRMQIELFSAEVQRVSDDLFIYALDEHILRHPAYLHVDKLAESCKRAAPRVTAWLMLTVWFVMAVFGVKYPPSEDADWGKKLAGLSPAQRHTIWKAHDELMGLSIDYIIRTSILARIFSVLVAAAAVIVVALEQYERSNASVAATMLEAIESALTKADRAELARRLPASILEAEAGIGRASLNGNAKAAA